MTTQDSYGMTTLRIAIQETIPANAETIFVKEVQPQWLKVHLTYPSDEMQKTTSTRLIEASVLVPVGSPLSAFMGRNIDRLGKIVFSIGATPETSQELVIPVRFAVAP